MFIWSFNTPYGVQSKENKTSTYRSPVANNKTHTKKKKAFSLSHPT